MSGSIYTDLWGPKWRMSPFSLQYRSSISGDTIPVKVIWKRGQFELEVSLNETVGNCKERLSKLFQVPSSELVLEGLAPNAENILNETKIGSLSANHEMTILLKRKKQPKEDNVTAENMIAVFKSNDLESVKTGTIIEELRNSAEVTQPDRGSDSEENIPAPVDIQDSISLLEERLRQSEVREINKPRAGKKLLVLDLDATIFDAHAEENPIQDRIRPFTHSFLAAVYPYYDIVVWSNTDWRWVEMKCTSLGLLTSNEFQIFLTLDRSHMFSIESRRPSGRIIQHRVKPLQLIWCKFSEFYNLRNTVHVDDVNRNFALNPANGIKIRPFKNGHIEKYHDKELIVLAKYLIFIKDVSDVTAINHKIWKKAVLTGLTKHEE